MTIEEKIAVMQAFKEGKEIESKINFGVEWHDTATPSWDFSTFEYRVKPEPEPPKYVPFSFDDDLVGKVVINGNIKAIILAQKVDFVRVDAMAWTDYIGLLKNYTFLDGSPCGKIIEK